MSLICPQAKEGETEAAKAERVVLEKETRGLLALALNAKAMGEVPYMSLHVLICPLYVLICLVLEKETRGLLALALNAKAMGEVSLSLSLSL